MVSRYRATATGRVQGVGFRFFVNSQAITYGLTGWVKNMDNGSVQMEVQGPASKLSLFLDSITEGNRFIIVKHLERQEIPAVLGEHSFKVVY